MKYGSNYDERTSAAAAAPWASSPALATRPCREQILAWACEVESMTSQLPPHQPLEGLQRQAPRVVEGHLALAQERAKVLHGDVDGSAVTEPFLAQVAREGLQRRELSDLPAGPRVREVPLLADGAQDFVEVDLWFFLAFVSSLWLIFGKL